MYFLLLPNNPPLAVGTTAGVGGGVQQQMSEWRRSAEPGFSVQGVTEASKEQDYHRFHKL